MNAVLSIRQAAGLTQQELADLSGVAQPNIAAYENETRTPSPKMLARLSAAAKPRPSRVLREHRDEVAASARRHGAVDVRVFGSVARGQDRPGSDVDLLVTFTPDATLFDLVEFESEVSDILGVGVDVVSANGLRDDHARIVAEAIPL